MNFGSKAGGSREECVEWDDGIKNENNFAAEKMAIFT